MILYSLKTDDTYLYPPADPPCYSPDTFLYYHPKPKNFLKSP